MSNLGSGAARYGWRASIGFIEPRGTSDSIIYEFHMMAPPGVWMVHTTLQVAGLTQEDYDEALGRAAATVETLVDREADCIVTAGVPPIVSHGWGYEAQVLTSIRELTDLPAITDIGACIEGMKKLDMSRVVMLTGFNPVLHGDLIHPYLIDYVKHAGIEVVADAGSNTTPPDAVRRIPLGETYANAKALFQRAAPVDGIWITGAFMPSVGIIDALEQDLGVPVVSSMQALTWIGLRMAGVPDLLQGFGRLFEHDWPPKSDVFQGP
jgi:maleate isomerase